jgi:hypothetical protein
MIRSFFVTYRHALVHLSSSFGLILLCFAATRDLRVISICLRRQQSRWRIRWAGMDGRRLRVSSQSINRASNHLSKEMEIHPAQYDTVVHSKAQAIRRCLRFLARSALRDCLCFQIGRGTKATQRRWIRAGQWCDSHRVDVFFNQLNGFGHLTCC